MKIYRIPIFTEEYVIHVRVGKKYDVIKSMALFLKRTEEEIADCFVGRGHSFDGFPETNPIIGINGDLPIHIRLATLAHETSHAMEAIAKFICMEDKSGEFHAHGISTVLRTVGKDMLKLESVHRKLRARKK